MNRIEIIYALAQYAHPSWYHEILNWPTLYLEALLCWYKTRELIKNDPDIKSRLNNGFNLTYTHYGK